VSRRLFRTVSATLLALLALEVALRMFVPRSALLDRREECYWIARIHERSESPEGEAAIRNVVRDPLLGWRMRPGYDEDGERIDAHGVRSDREVPFERTEGTRRIVALGDSFTFGLGVANGLTWVDLLGGELDGVETVNLGVNGFGTDQQVLQWERLGRRYAPDLVLLGFFVPDFHRNALSVRELPKPRFRLREGALELEPGPLPDPRALVEARLAECGSTLRALDLLSFLGRRLAAAEADGPFEEKAALLRALLERLRDSTREHGARLALVVLPDERFRAYADHERIERAAEDAAAELGIPLLNLTEPLAAWPREHAAEDVFDRVHGHWTEGGHALAAERIAAFVTAQELLGTADGL